MAEPALKRKLAELVQRPKITFASGFGKRVLIAGGSGFIGSELRKRLLELEYEVIVLSRHGAEGGMPWDGKAVGAWKDELEGAFAIFNLCGETIVQNWNTTSMPRLQKSRLNPTKAIAEAIEQCQEPPRVWLNASAVGFYGDRGEETLPDNALNGDRHHFLVQTCVMWEDCVNQAKTVGTSRVILRFGQVLGRTGGAFPKLVQAVKWFLGCAYGNGRQYVPWIHVRDAVNMMIWLMQEQKSGTYNVVSPNPVTNSRFMAELRKDFGRPPVPRMPKFLLKFVHFANGPHPSILLASQRAVPERALREGFLFEFPELQNAIENLVE